MYVTVSLTSAESAFRSVTTAVCALSATDPDTTGLTTASKVVSPFVAVQAVVPAPLVITSPVTLSTTTVRVKLTESVCGLATTCPV
ncbi:hypothetical protein NPX96_33215 [Bacillus cereus]|nr:hypothetical protein [Bacillus cereus]MCQ6300960.1 hypothetical protein [Bacillus cereus]MCQ6325137.1 hypothetical protein [Bacillus cereus]MCQ6519738.1 hypothetical protein [Bacillus cereus]